MLQHLRQLPGEPVKDAEEVREYTWHWHPPLVDVAYAFSAREPRVKAAQGKAHPLADLQLGGLTIAGSAHALLFGSTPSRQTEKLGGGAYRPGRVLQSRAGKVRRVAKAGAGRRSGRRDELRAWSSDDLRADPVLTGREGRAKVAAHLRARGGAFVAQLHTNYTEALR